MRAPCYITSYCWAAPVQAGGRREIARILRRLALVVPDGLEVCALLMLMLLLLIDCPLLLLLLLLLLVSNYDESINRCS